MKACKQTLTSMKSKQKLKSDYILASFPDLKVEQLPHLHSEPDYDLLCLICIHLLSHPEI